MLISSEGWGSALDEAGYAETVLRDWTLSLNHLWNVYLEDQPQKKREV